MSESHPLDSSRIGNTANITFENQPRTSDNPKVQERHAERMNLAHNIASFLEIHPLFKESKLTVTFAQDGVASLICILTKPDTTKVVLKIPFGKRQTKSEAFAFRAWNTVGASAPKVIEDGMFDDTHAYLLMNFIDAPTLDKKYTLEELLQEKAFVELGKLLAHMHQAKGVGFGPIDEEGRGMFTTFEEWLARDKMLEDISYVIENHLMDQESIEKAQAILIAYSKTHPESSVCHLDFAINNVFATTPPTVFDAAPEFNLPCIDVGKTIVNMNADGSEAIAQFLEGYQRTSTAIFPPHVIHASVVLMMIRKLANSHKTGGEAMEARIARNQQYLRDHVALLDV